MSVLQLFTHPSAFYDPLEKVKDIGPFEHFDPGHRADPKKPNLLKNVTKMTDLSCVFLRFLGLSSFDAFRRPHVGTEIYGVQLSELNSAGLDELALMAAERGALVFRDQNFKDIGFEEQKQIVS